MKTKTVLATLSALTLLAVGGLVTLLPLGPAVHRPAPVTKTFEVNGRIRAVDAASKVIRITHEEIPNYMPAMTMPLSVKDVALLKGLSTCDEVHFQLVVTDDDSWISRIERKSADHPDGPATAQQPPASLEERERARVQLGEIVPDFKLLNQDGQAVRLRDYRGKAVVLTFIYTRCPLPNFCPLMSKNFAELEERLGKEFPNRFHLLSVSMDSEFDRPEVLREYAGRYGASTNDWTFATGDADQINFVAELMGLYFVRENGLISHDLRTALIGPDGRLVHLWKSNVWTPYEAQRMVRETLTGERDVAAK
jgi:protein SCO1